jgi:hypothetical protein
VFQECEGQVVPVPETCDAEDQDCDGVADDGVLSDCGNCNTDCEAESVGVDADHPFDPDSPGATAASRRRIQIRGVVGSPLGFLPLSSNASRVTSRVAAPDDEDKIPVLDRDLAVDEEELVYEAERLAVQRGRVERFSRAAHVVGGGLAAFGSALVVATVAGPAAPFVIVAGGALLAAGICTWGGGSYLAEHGLRETEEDQLDVQRRLRRVRAARDGLTRAVLSSGSESRSLGPRKPQKDE